MDREELLTHRARHCRKGSAPEAVLDVLSSTFEHVIEENHLSLRREGAQHLALGAVITGSRLRAVDREELLTHRARHCRKGSTPEAVLDVLSSERVRTAAPPAPSPPVRHCETVSAVQPAPPEPVLPGVTVAAPAPHAPHLTSHVPSSQAKVLST